MSTLFLESHCSIKELSCKFSTPMVGPLEAIVSSGGGII